MFLLNCCVFPTKLANANYYEIKSIFCDSAIDWEINSEILLVFEWFGFLFNKSERS